LAGFQNILEFAQTDKGPQALSQYEHAHISLYIRIYTPCPPSVNAPRMKPIDFPQADKVSDFTKYPDIRFLLPNAPPIIRRTTENKTQNYKYHNLTRKGL
jgi:hypothetical protein